jgi:hypothetical protein
LTNTASYDYFLPEQHDFLSTKIHDADKTAEVVRFSIVIVTRTKLVVFDDASTLPVDLKNGRNSTTVDIGNNSELIGRDPDSYGLYVLLFGRFAVLEYFW